MEYTVTYGCHMPAIPDRTIHTEITTYFWPGFLGEFSSVDGSLRVWELRGTNTMITRPDIHVPPANCIAVESTAQPVQVWKHPTTRSLHYYWPSQSVWRTMTPRDSSALPPKVPSPMPVTVAEVQSGAAKPSAGVAAPPSLLQLCRSKKAAKKCNPPTVS
jgi:hypothetical protein